MPVTTTHNRKPYVGNGVQTVFPYDFKIFASADLDVYVAGVLQPITAYTVSGVGASGGDVTFVTAPANLAEILLIRVLEPKQETTYPSNDKFPAIVHQDIVDKLTMMIQQLEETDERTLRVAVSSLFNGLLVPDPVSGKALRWKADLSGLENYSAGTGSVLGTPVSMAEGGTGAIYANAHALRAGLDIAAWKKGADIAAAATLTLPNPLDGNYIKITGNTGVSAISTAGIDEGSVLRFEFTGTPVLTHGANFFLSGAVNYTVQANDVFTFMYLGASKWLEIGRYVGGGTTSKFWRGDGTWATVAAVVGTYSARGIDCKNNAATPDTQFDLDADVIVLRDASNEVVVRHAPGAALTNNISTAGPAANGRDQAGAFTASTFVHFYWIWDGTTLATVSSAVASPTGPTLPTGYTHWAYAGAVRLDGSSVLKKVRIKGSWVRYEASENVLSNGLATAETTVSVSAVVPSAALEFDVYYRHGTGAGTFWLRYISGSNYLVEDPSLDRDGGTIVFPNVSQQFFYAQGAAIRVDAWVLGYKVANGGE